MARPQAPRLLLIGGLALLIQAAAALTTASPPSDELEQLAQPVGGSAAVLEHLNSLDYAARHHEGPHHHGPAPSVGAAVASENNNGQAEPASLPSPANSTTTTTTTTTAAPGGSRGRRSRSRQHTSGSGQHNRRQANQIGGLITNLLGQLERVDFKRLLSELSSSALLATRQQQQQQQQQKSSARSGGVGDAPSSAASKQQSATAASNLVRANSSQLAAGRNGKVNVSALSAETGNLLSITGQLVKLARNQVLGTDYFGAGPAYYSASPGVYSSSWLSPLALPSSMLSAASHALHDSLDAHGHPAGVASLKSEWLWWLAPAVVVIGSGVILVPLLAAWLISQAMSQNTLTVSAGRRRRRRRRSVGSARAAAAAQDHHFDLMKLLDVHRLLDDAPELLVEQLSRFYDALEHVGTQFLKPAAGEQTAQGNAARKRHQLDDKSGEA